MTDKHTPEQVRLTDDDLTHFVECEMKEYWDGGYADTTGSRDQLRRFALSIEQAVIAKIKPEIDQLTKQRDDLLAALKDAVTVAKSAHECWDNDQDSKVGKYLIALAGGLPGYDKRTDEIHAAIAAVKDKP